MSKDELVRAIQGFDFLATFKVERNPRIKIKLQALHHLQNGESITEVARITLYSAQRVSIWLRRFVEFNYEGLIDRKGRGRKPRLPPEKEELFKEKLEEMNEKRKGGSCGVFEIQSLLADEFDCCYSRSGVYALLDRLNIVWISGRSKHPKSSDEAMEQFKEMFPIEVKKIKEKLKTNKIEVWWQDECRVGQQGSLSRMWARPKRRRKNEPVF